MSKRSASSTSAAAKKAKGKVYKTPDAFFSLMARTRANALKPNADNRIFIAMRDDKIVDIWEGLNKHSFLSVPVLQKTKTKWYGFLDLADICEFFVQHMGETKLKSDKDYRKLMAEDKLFKGMTVDSIMRYPLTRRNPFHPINERYSLFTVLETLAREPNLRRVPIVDNHRKLRGLVTTSRIVGWIHKNKDLLGDKLNEPVSLMERSSKVVTAKESDRAIDAFSKMTSNHINGVAVVDDAGKLVDTLSIRDLKGVETDGSLFHHLFSTVKEFIHHLHNASYFKTKATRPRIPVTMKITATLGDVMEHLNSSRVHQVFVVDGDGIPTSVIGLNDILSTLLQ